MQIRATNVPEGETLIEVIDPSDGACTHTANISDGEQITVTATTATSPADIEFGEVEAIPVAEPEPDAETAAANEQKVAEQPTPPDDDPEDQAA